MAARRPELDLPGLGADEGQDRAPGASLVGWTMLFLRAARRRKRLAAAVFVLGVNACAVYYWMKVPTYRAQAKILAQRQQALPSVVRSGAGDEVPTRSAWDLVHRRDNLVALVKQVGLFPEGVEAQPGLRARMARVLSRLTGKAPRPEDPLSELVMRLDGDLEVTTGEGTVTIAIDWPDAQQAYQLVEAAVQNFLEARHLQEITAIDEVISLLQGRVATLRDEADRTPERVQRDPSRGTEASSHPGMPRGEELVRLRTMIEAKDRAIADVEEFRRRRLADLQAQLDAQRAVYSERHPSMIALHQDIAALGRESPQIVTLREEARKLRLDHGALLAQDARAATTPSRSRTLHPGGNAGVEQNERARDARFRYQQMVERVNAAQIDLDAARSAFKYRYNVIWPPEVPREPVSPRPRVIFGLGALASLLLALFAAAAPDLRAGRIVERWQVERSLDLPILGQVSRK